MLGFDESAVTISVRGFDESESAKTTYFRLLEDMRKQQRAKTDYVLYISIYCICVIR